MATAEAGAGAAEVSEVVVAASVVLAEAALEAEAQVEAGKNFQFLSLADGFCGDYTGDHM